MLGCLCVGANAAEGAAAQVTTIKYYDMRISENFKLSEFDCNDGTKVPEEYISNVIVLGWMLQELRDYLGKPIIVNSGYRTKAYNKKVGGNPNSMHLKAMAADIVVKGMKPTEVKKALEHLISIGEIIDGGIGVYPNFLHYDIGKIRRW